MHVTAIIAAGGRGVRFGGGEPKQLRTVGGRAILERSVAAFVAHTEVDEVIVALPAHLVDDPPPYLRALPSVRLVAGGARRQDSVANAFRAADAASDVIVIHDAARPFVGGDLIARTIKAAAESGAAVAALQARDTVKRTQMAADERRVAATLPRAEIFLAQTPQAFRRDVLAAALAHGDRDGIDATDEAALAERAGHVVRIVEGEPSNIKITTPEDLVVGEAIASQLDRGPARTGRAGTGYDLHRLIEGRPLMICGVNVPADRGALGHSDADVGCHAITDALLGALGLGDIGSHFPDSDPRWKGAGGLDLLTRVVELIASRGYQVGNVDVTILLESPKLREHVDAMRRALAAALGVDVERVSVKAKTNEGVDAVGRGEAIAAHAIALIRARS
jgi:2-C-methyl-D-erythritol 4-phosphate cytidylyltransferase / 2-C-methyl-D-erythritol 2,4-cyclodiphosphate synthase